MSDSLSQEEIDKLMKGNNESAASDKPAEGKSAEEKKTATNEKKAPATEIESKYDEQTKQDIIGEVGNISMSQAATTLSSILNHRVTITTPKVSRVYFKDLISDIATPKVAMTVGFKEGLIGTNLMLLQVKDANVIADLMMGGNGEPKSQDFTEVELSAVSEAMNQMIGSSATAMATMINRKVDILPPDVKVWREPDNIQYDNIGGNQKIYKVSFSLNVEGLIKSEIMQIFTEDMVEDIADAMMADKATVVKEHDTDEEKQPAPTANKVQPQPQQPKPQPDQQTTTASRPSQLAPKPKQTVEVSQPEFQQLSGEKVPQGDNLDLIMDVPLNLSVVLGRAEKSVRDILSFNSGSVVELNRLTDEPLEILLNGKLIATGEVVVINENFGIRITNIVSQRQRIDHMS
ncbi:MAG: flagellar motor switch phosphatase FliY [Liquorilactobacillus nagelii]|jgi:flagellar motor switch protein FliN/FliY|uniref:flagellar motor switch phosphatase FliY n=1 Tax=Liquorilactobacillus nagelii TaxID=82688 RepID=UPI00242B471C|nr:flagellar motor switch phosphatase FliY [Liquorilactobacillus nagelii]MCI1920807.1 flagellar motor switch phosphatase FliY [Liquorilactobacillus nagelii]MCI1976861.1 flagellar motor switch phosphatase FliY [Liquorilactobacillus nagelii]